MKIIPIYKRKSIEELKKIVSESFSYRELGRKLGYTHTCSGNTLKVLEKWVKQNNISTEHFTHRANGFIERTNENVFVENSTASQCTLRRFFIKGNFVEYKCSICGQLPEWNGKELTLILDHINGINNDDRLENLRWVCPNCNQQLDTTGFKNFRTKK